MKVWEVSYSSGSYDDFYVHSECLCADKNIAEREAAKIDKRNGIDNPFTVMKDGDEVFNKIEQKVYEKYCSDEEKIAGKYTFDELGENQDLLYTLMNKIEPKYSVSEYKTYDDTKYMEYSKAEITEREVLMK